jgi:DNA excision repair protein ERCC-2
MAIKPVFDRFSTVVITSGTLSPPEMYPRMLNFTTVLEQSYTMTLTRNCFLPIVYYININISELFINLFMIGYYKR